MKRMIKELRIEDVILGIGMLVMVFLYAGCSSPSKMGPFIPPGGGTQYLLHAYKMDDIVDLTILYTRYLGYKPMPAPEGKNCDDKELKFQMKGGVFSDAIATLVGVNKSGLLLCAINKNNLATAKQACHMIDKFHLYSYDNEYSLLVCREDF